MHLWVQWDFWVASFTLLLVAATCWLALEARRALEHARRSSEQQLRAYVLPQHMDLFDGTNLEKVGPERDNTPCIVINLTNFGKTPAYELIHWAQIDVRPTSEEKLLVAPDLENKSASTMGPGSGLTKTLWFNRQLSLQELKDIDAGIRQIFVYGRLTYKDAFGEDRHAKYRMKYVGKYPPINSGSMTYCDDGNESN